MSIDYYVCKNCGKTFSDWGDYVSCDCGEKWCCLECAEEDGYVYDEETDESNCSYCRGEKLDLDDRRIKELIQKYSDKHPLAKECGGEYIYQDDKAQVDAIELVSKIFDLFCGE